MIRLAGGSTTPDYETTLVGLNDTAFGAAAAQHVITHNLGKKVVRFSAVLDFPNGESTPVQDLEYYSSSSHVGGLYLINDDGLNFSTLYRGRVGFGTGPWDLTVYLFTTP